MKGNIEERACQLALYIIENKTTVRGAARKFGISKSTVHKDLTERLPELNKERYELVKVILENNKAERHLRGGEATRQKYAYQAKLWPKNEKKRNFEGNISCIRKKNILK